MRAQERLGKTMVTFDGVTVDIDALRDRLNEIDRKIVDLMAERQSVVDDIGERKRDEGRPTRDFQREKQVIDQARARATDLGLPPRLAEALMQLLIRSSLTSQERARVRATARRGSWPVLL